MKEIIFPHVSIKYIEPIVYCKYNKGVELGFPEIKELISCAETLSNKKPCLILSDIRSIMNITSEGKRMLERYTHLPFCMGTAVFVGENKYECAQDFVSSYQPNFPFRVFNSEREAIDWLLTLSLDC
jgi:hypothetical protein